MSFVVNGKQIKNPSTFKIERYNVTNMERLSNATMVGDLIAKKEKYYFTYDAISAEDLDVILDAVFSATLFFPLTFTDRGKTITKIVYVGSIPSELHYMGKGITTWKNVTFNLIER